MKILKFGGSSVADADRIALVVSIIADQHRTERVCAVFSAMRGVTDALYEASEEAAAGGDGFGSRLAAVRARTTEAADRLVTGPSREELGATLDALFDQLGELLHGVRLVRECSPRTQDLIVGFGERVNCALIVAAMRERGLPARYVDARTIIRTDDAHGNAAVDFAASYRLIADALAPTDTGPGGPEDLPVVTGFIAATEAGVATTLGRNGSDYTASILGAGVGASAIEIWTDVDGVYSADPRFVKGAFILPEVSYQEAMELSYFGAKVIHPYTMIPAVEKRIPLWIRNTLNPSAPGTLIGDSSEPGGGSVGSGGDPGKTAGGSVAPAGRGAITGIASIESVAMVNVEGGGMVGLPGVAGRVFGALASARINIVMISQASSEHSICFVVRDAEAKRAVAALERDLAGELARRQVERIGVILDLEIVAVIGEKMRGKPGISGRLFGALGDAGVNVLAIAQGSSEMNISFVVNRTDRERTLNVVHQAFFPEAGS